MAKRQFLTVNESIKESGEPVLKSNVVVNGGLTWKVS
jgi:hypothetical protein